MLIRKDLLEEAGLFLPGQKRFNDVDLWLRMAYRGARIGYIYEPLAVYHLGIENSIVKTHTDWRHIDDFLARHLALAQNADRLDAFRPCAQIQMNHWLRTLMVAGQGYGVRRMIRRVGFFPLRSFTLSCYIGSFWPSLWNRKEDIKRRIRKNYGRR